jgi:FkbM family methyltransferase
MGLLQGIRNTFATTENYFSGLMMHVSSQPRVIKFKGSPPMEMTPKEYFTLKYAVLYGFTVSRDGDEWELSKGDTRLRMTKESFSYVLIDEGILSHYKPIEFKGKTVLDVGGYIGDTAVMFHHLGAEKIVIYEPVKEHLPLIRKNIELNHINAEVKNLGVGISKGPMEVPFSKLGLRFGNERVDDLGMKTKTILLEDIKTVIRESHADIAKFNCETCEKAILSLDPETIRKIPVYVVETHGEELEAKLLEKFSRAGFEIIKSTRTPGKSPLHTFKLS